MLQLFADDLWISDGPAIKAAAGFHYPTRMAVMRLADGGLLVWSPIRLTAELAAAVASIGPVRHLLAPNSLHHMYLPEWARAFPDAAVHGAPGVAAKRADVRFDTQLREGQAPAWGEGVDTVVVPGNRITTEAILFHRQSRTVLITDLVQCLPAGWFSGWRAIVAKLDLMTGPAPSVPRKFRLAFTDRQAARTAIGEILAWDCERIVMAHGQPVTDDGQAVLKQAFSWLV